MSKGKQLIGQVLELIEETESERFCEMQETIAVELINYFDVSLLKLSRNKN